MSGVKSGRTVERAIHRTRGLLRRGLVVQFPHAGHEALDEESRRRTLGTEQARQVIDQLADGTPQGRVFRVGVGRHQGVEREPLIVGAGHVLGERCLGAHDQSRLGVEVGEHVAEPAFLVLGLSSGEVPGHDGGLQLPAGDVAEIGPVVGGLGRVGPKHVEVGQAVLVDHLVEIVVGPADERFDGEGLGRLGGLRRGFVARPGAGGRQAEEQQCNEPQKGVAGDDCPRHFKRSHRVRRLPPSNAGHVASADQCLE